MPELPIERVLPELRERLDKGSNAVLQAAPGAGKSTAAPPSLLGARWMEGRKILLLQPRRLAAQMVAGYMASRLGEAVGRTVGYRIRGESKTTKATRIEVVTEGILTRLIQQDPALEEVGLVIFDEFHERSIHAELGLAFCLESQSTVRPDLRLLVMSATLEGTRVAALLGNAPVVLCPGRSYPVETEYLQSPSALPTEELVAAKVKDVLRRASGDILAFLPGKREISRTADRLEQLLEAERVLIRPLYSEAGQEAQKRALEPTPEGMRKVILATSIAETSLTIEGVRVVIDSGLTRAPRYDPRRGMERLETLLVSGASAEQRRGRAGRTAPGLCLRLWTRAADQSRPEFAPPEILTSDLVPFCLDVARWGARDVHHLSLLDYPPAPSVRSAHETLRRLEALDGSGRITAHGTRMSELSVHPRLAHMLLRSLDIGLAPLACDVAALLEERDLLRGREADVSLSERWHLFDAFRRAREAPRELRSLLIRLEQQAARLRTTLNIPEEQPSPSNIGLLVALAYPDRIAKRRERGSRRYLLSNGAGAELPDRSFLQREEYLSVAELDGKADHAKIFLAEPLSRSDILHHFVDHLEERKIVGWSTENGAVVSRQEERLGAIVLGERSLPASPETVREAMLEGVRSLGLSALPWSEEARILRSRSEWLRESELVGTGWPDLSDERLLETLPLWLGPFLNEVDRRERLARIQLVEALRALFSWDQLQELHRLAPPVIELRTGTKAKVTYEPGARPSLSALLQELFGEAENPTVGGGKVPVALTLLSPARRPLQVTSDLGSFWKSGYTAVRKEMQGRYPKHYWPVDPMTAEPTRRPKSRAG